MGSMDKKVALLCAVMLGLQGCASPRHYSRIPASWDIRNSPIPVPKPKAKPSPPKRYAQRPVTSAPVRTSSRSSGDITVARGDTVYGLSRKHGVPVRDLIAVNNLRPPYLLRPGDRLNLPGARFHVVQKGETGYGISRKYDVDVTTLMRMNNIRPPYRLSVGQKLRLPQAAVKVAAAPLKTTPKRTIVRTPPPSSSPAQTEIKASNKVSSNGFQWPVEGRVISSFGPKENGLHNDGINIAAKRGAHVRAARDGVVAYAGNGFKGFGNILLVRHSGGWITAYAHNERLLVSKGQAVKRGQVIARAGSSGAVSTPQLHFEIRKGKEPVNPHAQLPKI